MRNLRITGSGLRLEDDNAAVFVTGNRATIESNVIENSLHGIYLRKVSDCRVVGNRIRGKATLLASTMSIEKTLTAGIGELCETSLDQNKRGNGIHQWNCERNFISGNEISETRDGIYFSFTNHSRAENNRVHNVRYGLHYMYSDNNVFENNLFSENAAGAAVMFSRDIVIRGNQFIDNRGSRAYGILFQSDEQVRVENNIIRNNAVGLSFQQANNFVVRANDVSNNYIGVRFYGNSDANLFTENRFTQNLHPVDVDGAGANNRWALNGVGNFWDNEQTFDLNRDGVNDLPHRELDLFGPLRRDLPGDRISFRQSGGEAAPFCERTRGHSRSGCDRRSGAVDREFLEGARTTRRDRGRGRSQTMKDMARSTFHSGERTRLRVHVSAPSPNVPCMTKTTDYPLQKKFAMARAPSPTREARVLPGSSHDRN